MTETDVDETGITIVEMGHIDRESVVTAEMPRDIFLGFVKKSCYEAAKDPDLTEDEEAELERKLIEKLMPVATTMDHFPLSTWINERRGCGCLIGEYLVASRQLERTTLAERIHGSTWTYSQTRSVRMMLEEDEPEFVQPLMEVGSDIDARIVQWLQQNELHWPMCRVAARKGMGGLAVVFTD